MLLLSEARRKVLHMEQPGLARGGSRGRVAVQSQQPSRGSTCTSGVVLAWPNGLAMCFLTAAVTRCVLHGAAVEGPGYEGPEALA